MNIGKSEDHVSAQRYIAWLDTGRAVPPARCYVEDVSKFGAKLRVFQSPVPGEFTLHFNRKGDAKVRCRVTSQAGSECAVEFVASLGIYD